MKAPFTKEELWASGVMLLKDFCRVNKIPCPTITRLQKTDRLYYMATCAYYRPTTINIMVEKCASPGMGGMAWSWPGYIIDRTPYGVLQHELGHHVDWFLSQNESHPGEAFSLWLHRACGDDWDKPLTGYLGTDKKPGTFEAEWFAEHFRLFVTNPLLSEKMAPKFYYFLTLNIGFVPPFPAENWEWTLTQNKAPARIIDMARKRINGLAHKSRQAH